LLESLNDLRKTISEKCQLCKNEDVAQIARRYFVINAFDGALTVLGIIIGTHVAQGVAQSKVIISAGSGTSLAMGISGVFGAYLTERSERIKDHDEVSRSRGEVTKEALYLALVDGFSPALAAIVGVSPFIVSHLGVVHYETAFVASVLMVMAELFSRGIFLGRIAKRSMILHGFVTLLAGVATFAVISTLALYL